MQAASSMNFTDRVREVWSRRKWLAAVVFVFTMAAGVTLALSVPDVYRATATVLVEEPRVESSVAGELDRRLQMISQEILSRARLEALVQRFRLYPGLRARAPREAAIVRMRRDIRTEFKAPAVAGDAGGTIMVAVSYQGGSPQTVAEVANALAGFYLEEDRNIRERQASGAVQLLAAQLQDLKQSVDARERELADFQERHLGELPQQSEANLAALDQLHADLRATNEERMRALDRRNDLLRRLAELDDGSAVSIGAAPTTSRLDKLRDELADLQRRFSDRYPDVIRLKAEIAALERQSAAAEVRPSGAATPATTSGRAAALLRQSVDEVERQIAVFKADESRLRSAIAGYIQRLENSPRRQRGLQEISRDYQTTRDLYDTLRKRYEQAQLDEGTQAGDAGPRFRILDTAVVPSGPVAPNRLFLLLLTLVGSLAMATAAAGLTERLDTSFHNADDIRAFTRVPVLASIPVMRTPKDVWSRRRRFALVTLSVVLAMGAVVHTLHGLARGNEGLFSILAKFGS